MPGVDQSEHERLSQRFNEARRLFGAVLEKKGPWLVNRSNPSHYSDPETVAALKASLTILADMKETLKSKPDAREWLLHLSGTHWQSALTLFLLGRYDEAAAENNTMSGLIDGVPNTCGSQANTRSI